MSSYSSSCFSEHNILMCENGDVYSFGFNAFGQCGTGHTLDVFKPIKITNNPAIKSIILGVNHSFYLEKNGDLFGCGNNRQNQLGIQNSINPYEFLRVTSNIKKVCTSYSFTLVQKENGQILFVGNGLNKYSSSFIPIEIDEVESFSCGGDHCYFLKRNGELWVMGSNKYGQLGLDVAEAYVYEPRLLISDKNIVSFSCGYEYSFILTKLNDKTILKCCGRNDFGQLGINHQKNQFDLYTIDQFQDIESVHCSVFHTFILLKDGNVYSTGFNGNGQLCLGKFSINTSQFTKTNLLQVSHITTGYCHSIFVNKSKQIFVCGNSGRLGLGDKDYRNDACQLTFDGLKLIQNIQFVHNWSPSEHVYFSQKFKDSVLYFLYCLKNKSKSYPFKQNIYKVPKPIIFIIIKYTSCE